jgi:hypothetical protein
VAKGLGEEALLDSSIVASADELLFELLVDALCARLWGDGDERAQTRNEECGATYHARTHSHLFVRYQRSLETVNLA